MSKQEKKAFFKAKKKKTSRFASSRPVEMVSVPSLTKKKVK